MSEVRCVVECRDILGEGPLWCPEDEVLWWIDCAKPALSRFDPATGAYETWSLPKPIGSIALKRSGGFLLAFRSGLATFDRPGSSIEWLDMPGADLTEGRFNDGKCDRAGRFWVGTLDRAVKQRPVGELYRIDPGLTCTVMDKGFAVSNGLGWSPDDRTMYFTDTPVRTIYAYDFDLASGSIANRRVFVRFDERPGRPDGLAVDAEGFVWTARVEGWCIDRYAPDGSLERTVRVPVQRPLSCAFGGPDLGTLYVTTSTYNLAPEALAQQPLAGALLALEPGVKGMPQPRFAA